LVHSTGYADVDAVLAELLAGVRGTLGSSAQGVEASRRASPDVPRNPREACCGKTTAFCGNTTPGITIGSPGTSPSAVATLCT